MVMEAPPSPQSVGREFVRQYYTLLNSAPTHLHRFYNHQSSFVHGGLDPPNRETSPVIGQKQIHQKIQQLNFRDCHAKITQVDSQATLGNGVVVQVTGELSNAGQPMRRFTQTFVLAAQSPKKYYVHNDIFRYQDEIISDEECETDVRSEGDEDNTDRQVIADIQQPMPQPTITAYYSPATGQIPPTAIPQIPIHHGQQPAPPHVVNAQPVATVNGSIHPEDINVLSTQVPSHVPPPAAVQQPQQNLGVAPVVQQQPVSTPVGVTNPGEELRQVPIPQVREVSIPAQEELETGGGYGNDQHEVEQQQEPPQEPTSNEPKTYANLLKSGNNSSCVQYGLQQSQVSGGVQHQSQPTRTVSPTSGVGISPQQQGARAPRSGGMGVPRNQPMQQQRNIPNRQDSGRGGQGRGSLNEDGTFEDRRRPQGQGFNDVNQLFLGNLPHTATEDELREIFSEFGVILDLRVHSKPNAKIGGPPGGRAPPNYGFITYETQHGVMTCLQAKPIYYPKDDKNGTLLNVEEKKTKERPSYGGGMGGGRPNLDVNRGGGRGDNNLQRRMGVPGGPNRNPNGGPAGQNPRNNTYSNRNNGPPNNRGVGNYGRR